MEAFRANIGLRIINIFDGDEEMFLCFAFLERLMRVMFFVCDIDWWNFVKILIKFA